MPGSKPARSTQNGATIQTIAIWTRDQKQIRKIPAGRQTCGKHDTIGSREESRNYSGVSLRLRERPSRSDASYNKYPVSYSRRQSRCRSAPQNQIVLCFVISLTAILLCETGWSQPPQVTPETLQSAETHIDVTVTAEPAYIPEPVPAPPPTSIVPHIRHHRRSVAPYENGLPLGYRPAGCYPNCPNGN